MARAGVFLALMAVAVLAAALFGALHNQASYTLGPSYFHNFKFPQFRIAPDTPPRLGAAWVGVQASWWMGFLVGLPPFVLGWLTIPDPARFWRAGLTAIAAALAVTVLAAIAGAAFGVAVVGPETAGKVGLPEGLPDKVGFLRAGMMHNASYIGGGLGILAAFLVMRRAARR